MRAVITGGAGFIGSHLCDHLLAQGHRVTVLDDLSTGSLDNVNHLQAHPKFDFVKGSILDTTLVEKLIADADVVFHLAAAVGVKLIIDDPVTAIETNVLGTHAVLTAARKHQTKTVLASTSEVYGNGTKIPFGENDDRLMGPTTKTRWNYATTKALDEFWGLAYFQEFGTPIVICRFFNTVGPRQTGQYGMVVPRFVQQALAGEPLTVYGDGQQSRCFCDVSDVVRAISALAFAPNTAGEIFNIGNPEEITITALAERVISLADSQSAVTYIPYEQAYGRGFEDMQRRVPDIRKIQQFIDWQPQKSLDDILRRVIDYFRV